MHEVRRIIEIGQAGVDFFRPLNLNYFNYFDVAIECRTYSLDKLRNLLPCLFLSYHIFQKVLSFDKQERYASKNGDGDN